MTHWSDEAKCVGTRLDFYSERARDIERAKAVCATCPVLAECRSAGMSEEHGVWGGMSSEERSAKQAGQRHRDTSKAREASAQSRAGALQERMEEARRLRSSGLSLREVAERIGITHGAIRNWPREAWEAA